MGRIRTFDIAIENNGLTLAEGVPLYRPGGYVDGVVHLTMNTPRDDVKEISITLQGRAKTSWSEMVGSRSNVFAEQTVTFTGTETYINDKAILWQKVNPYQRLGRGPHAFPFRFQVPNEILPPAYEGASGHVRYRIKCEMSGDSSLSYTKISKPVAIAGRPLDLNSIQSTMLPVADESETLLSSLCCVTGSIQVQASADRRAYSPGETAYITAIVRGSNGTRYDVVLKLIEEATFRGTGSVFNSPGVSVARAGACQRSRVVTRKKTSGVLQRRGETTLRNEPMVIPNDRPIADSGFQGCSIIDIRYSIYVSPIVSRLRNAHHAEVRLPIIIGRIPLAALPSYHASNAHMCHPNEPPPSYETATSVHQTPPRQEASRTAFVNQAYSSVAEELAPPNAPRDDDVHDAPISRAQSPPRDLDRQVMPPDQLRSSLPPPQTSDSAGMQADEEVDSRGILNLSFSAEAGEEDAQSESACDGESPDQVLRLQQAEQCKETLVHDVDAVLQAPLPAPTLFSSLPKEAMTDTPSHPPEVQVSLQLDAKDVPLGESHDGEGERRLSLDSSTCAYFLPAYDKNLVGRVVTDDCIENQDSVSLRLQSFIPIRPDSDLESASVNDRTESSTSNTAPLPPPSPWKDEQPLPPQENTANSPLSDSAESPDLEVETFTASSFANQEEAPAVIKTYAWKEYISMSTEVEDDYWTRKTIPPDVQEDFSDSEADEIFLMPGDSTPERSRKSTQILVPKFPAEVFNFKNGSSFEFDEATHPPDKRVVDWTPERLERPPRLTSSSKSKESNYSSPMLPAREPIYGNVCIVHGSSREDSRTPSPYVHPDDGRDNQSDVSSVSSFGMYSPTTKISREWKHRHRSDDCADTSTSDPGGGRMVRTLPRSRSSGQVQRESATHGSLDRRGRGMAYSTHHAASRNEGRETTSDPRLGPRKGDTSSSNPRVGSPRRRKMRHTTSLPTMHDWRDTAHSDPRRLAAVLYHDDSAHSGTRASNRERPLRRSVDQPTQTSRPRTNLQDSPDDNTKKRSSYMSAIDNIMSERHHPETRQMASSSPSSKQDDSPDRIRSCLAYRSEDTGHRSRSERTRLETIV